MRTVILANHKGGVGKSAVATLLAQYWHRQRHRVLAIDLDHQGNFSSTVTLSKRASVATISADKLLTTPKVELTPDQFVLVPAGDGLLGLERQPALHTTFARNLRDLLKAVDHQFDVCVIDTQPNPDRKSVV